MAIDSLSRVIPRWVGWARRAAELEALSSADYPFPEPALKFLGVIVQRYRLRSGEPTRGFEKYFRSLQDAVQEKLIPALDDAGTQLPDELYDAAGLHDEQWLAAIPDFNTLIADSQRVRKPVFALTKTDVQRVGTVWDNTAESIERFRTTFDDLARRIEILTEADE